MENQQSENANKMMQQLKKSGDYINIKHGFKLFWNHFTKEKNQGDIPFIGCDLE